MINRLSLVNFKAFRRLGLPLGKLTLLSGVNATGKSTVMQALALLRQSYDAGMLGPDGGELLLNGDLVELGVGQDVLHEDYATEPGHTLPPIAIGLRHDGVQSEWSVRYNRASHREADVLPLVSTPAPDTGMGLFADGFQYLRADRIVPSVHYPKSYAAVVGRGFLGSRGEHTVNYLRARGDDRVESPSLRHKAAKSASLLDQTDAWFQDICPGVNLQAVDLKGTDLVRLSYGFFGTTGLRSSIRYRPTNVGFGLTYVLPVVVACLSSRPGRLILLENPEAHLHPRGQTAITRLACQAAASGAQLLIESHSDHVLNAVRLAVKDAVLAPNDVVLQYFGRDGDAIQVSSPSVGRDGMLSEWPVGFFDEWDSAIDRLLD